ncbi:DoxX family membrane protein [Pseudomonas benzenivorans]|uniref:DoxX family membrane protein n=1 Tax=Pseudomonas benzenivorans TaxID=556533 RepID=A0ABY5H5A9_9PSED|nr:DoxX family membrane protein [Pseudomonas benzenivorans]UTW06649.1 DoxX family membrane protein [Pseudomonas benzenivorans]
MPSLDLPYAPAAARLLLRIGLAAMWISHGLLLKLLTFGVDGLGSWLSGIGLPSALALPLIVAESLGGLLILLGLYGRWVSLALLPILLGALLIHAGNGWVFSNPNGGWEYPLFLAAMSLVHILLGDGPLALKAEGATP